MLACVFALIVLPEDAKPEVTRFYGGRGAAFSMEFDDSMESQIHNALPILKAHGLTATFYAVPGGGTYAKNRHVWESGIISAGFELGDHTMTHSDCPDAATAEREIGDAARIIERLYGGKPRLIPFAMPGGTKWNVSQAELDAIFLRHRLFMPKREAMFSNSFGDQDITRAPRQAMADKKWISLCLHGIGGEWISTSVADLERLATYVAENESSLWVCRTGDAWRYEKERDAVSEVKWRPRGRGAFDLEVLCDTKKVELFGEPFTALYNQPLTVRIPVSPAIRTVTASQSRRSQRAVLAPSRDAILIDVLPNGGVVRVETKG